MVRQIFEDLALIKRKKGQFEIIQTVLFCLNSLLKTIAPRLRSYLNYAMNRLFATDRAFPMCDTNRFYVRDCSRSEAVRKRVRPRRLPGLTKTDRSPSYNNHSDTKRP